MIEGRVPQRPLTEPPLMTSAPPHSWPDDTRHSLLVRLRDPADQRAWQEFCEIYEPMIYRLARSRGLQDADAREIVQDVFVAVMKSIDSFRRRPGGGGFRAWLATVTRNTALNRLKQSERQATGGTSVMNRIHQLPATKHDHASIEQAFTWEHRRQLFLWAANRLQDRFSVSNWQAFWMTCVQGHSIHQVAAELNVSESKVHVARCRVIARIRELVAGQTSQEAGEISEKQVHTDGEKAQ